MTLPKVVILSLLHDELGFMIRLIGPQIIPHCRPRGLMRRPNPCPLQSLNGKSSIRESSFPYTYAEIFTSQKYK